MKDLSNFHTSTLEVIRTGELSQLETRMSLLKDMLQQGISCSVNPNESNVLRTLNNYFSEWIESLIERNEFLRASKYLHLFYKMVLDENKKKPIIAPFTLDVEYSLANIFYRMQKDTLDNKRTVLEIGLLILRNMFMEGRYSCVPLYSQIYSIMEDLVDTSQASKLFMNQFLEEITSHIYTREAPSSENLQVKIILSILYTIIHRRNSARFSQLIKLVNEYLTPYGKEYEGIIVSMVVYLYYLSYREDAVEHNRRSEYKQYLTNSSSGVNLQTLFDLYSQRLWDFYIQTKETLNMQWEEWGEEQTGKALVLGTVVDEFFVLNTLRDPQSLTAIEHEIPSNVFTEENVFRFLQYFKGHELIDSYNTYLRNLEDALGGNISNESTAVYSEQFAKFLKERYKDYQFNKILKFWRNDNNLISAVNDITKLAKEDAQKNGFFKIAEKDVSQPVNKILTLQIPTSAFPVNSPMFTGTIQRRINSIVLSELSKHQVKTIDFPFNEDDTLLRTLLGKLNSLNPDTLVFASVHNNRIQYVKNRHLVQKIMDLDEKLKKIENTNTLSSVYLNQNQIQILSGEVYAVGRLRSQEEIQEELNRAQDGNQYNIVVVNNIDISCSKEEAEFYLTHSIIKFDVYMDISLHIKNIDGALIVNYRLNL